MNNVNFIPCHPLVIPEFAEGKYPGSIKSTLTPITYYRIIRYNDEANKTNSNKSSGFKRLLY